MNGAQWTALAQADLAGLADYYADFSPGYADRLGLAALAAGRFLADRPGAGSTLALGTRKWRLRGFEVVLIYREISQGVEIVRARHARGNWRDTP